VPLGMSEWKKLDPCEMVKPLKLIYSTVNLNTVSFAYQGKSCHHQQQQPHHYQREIIIKRSLLVPVWGRKLCSGMIANQSSRKDSQFYNKIFREVRIKQRDRQMMFESLNYFGAERPVSVDYRYKCSSSVQGFILNNYEKNKFQDFWEIINM